MHSYPAVPRSLCLSRSFLQAATIPLTSLMVAVSPARAGRCPHSRVKSYSNFAFLRSSCHQQYARSSIGGSALPDFHLKVPSAMTQTQAIRVRLPKSLPYPWRNEPRRHVRQRWPLRQSSPFLHDPIMHDMLQSPPFDSNLPRWHLSNPNVPDRGNIPRASLNRRCRQHP